MPEYARVCQSVPEDARVCQAVLDYARVCQSMPEYARVCQSTEGGYGEMITVLHRGGYAQMITILHRGGGSLGTPKSDYVICAQPLNGKCPKNLMFFSATLP